MRGTSATKKSLLIGLSVIIATALFAAVFILCNTDSVKAEAIDEEPIVVSIINLVTTPEKYHNKTVWVFAAVNIEEDDQAAYLSQEDASHHITKNAVWLELDSERLTEFSNEMFFFSEGQYMQIIGVFDMNDLGVNDMYSGTIVDIERFVKWRAVGVDLEN